MPPESKPVVSNIPPLGVWNHLGSRTYWLFLYQKLETAAVFFIFAIIFTVARSVSAIPTPIIPLLGLLGVACFAIFFVALAIALIMAWIIYRSHEYMLGDDALKIRQGIVTKQEIAIPYRQIQNVDIERTFSEQMLGLSKLVILTAGQEEKNTKEDESEGILPAMDKHLAVELQEELLKRAEVQKVITVNK